MSSTLLHKLCSSLQTPALAKRYSDAAFGLLLMISIQLLVLPTQIALDLHSINIPASILVLLLVLIVMIVSSSINRNTVLFYDNYLRGPTAFVGRHMSLGFVAFFILLIRDHIDSSSDIPKLAGAFVVTTIMSYVASFTFASGGYHVEQRLRRSKKMLNDLESNNRSWPSPSIAWPAPAPEPESKRISQLSTISEALSTKESIVKVTPLPDDSEMASIDFLFQTVPIWAWLFLLITVGLPVYLVAGYAMPFDVFSFSLFWVLSIQLQKSLRSSPTLHRVPRLRSFSLIFANPLVLTWALGTAYIWLKTLYTRMDLATVVTEFRHHNSLSDSIIHIMQDHDVSAHVGAGDLASILLDAGVACMGFKMYEYRSELWASLGTVSFTCVALAAFNVFLNVLVCRGIGLDPAEAIAFAGRSATLALGIPAIGKLGGLTTLTSTLAIINGILFQMVGDWLFSVMRINDRTPQAGSAQTQPIRASVPTNSHTPFCVGMPISTTETTCINQDRLRTTEDSAVVAAGVTTGINAAAMGTALLMERNSRAVAYSALSMIMFGAATVALTALPGTAEAVIFLASM
ncbi:hypothetical protein F4808DRAFT_454380 [Astrocystis sublimbata]|nr:hypothetical protein F4808DRAFT_454380 [Astrocystis sublimbata]